MSRYGGLVIECVDVSVAAQDEVGAGDEDTGGEAHQGQTEPGSDPTEAGRGWSGFDSARSSTTSNLRIEHCDFQNFALHHFTLSHQHAHKPCRTYSKHHDNTRVGFKAQTVTQSKPDDALPVAPPHHLSAPPSQHVYWWHFRVADVPLRWRMPQRDGSPISVSELQ